MVTLRAVAMGAAVAAAAGMAWGQTSQTADPGKENLTKREQIYTGDQPKSESMDDLVDKAKHPFEHFTWGADERIRQEYINNHFTLNGNQPNHEYDFGRYRTRLWATYSPAEFIDLNARLAWEWRQWYTPQTKPSEEWNYVFFDTLNFKLKSKELNAYLTVGRQDIMLGDGWLVMDGTPLDGSTSIYFDAARFNIAFPSVQTTVDAIYINQYSAVDKWLPTINDGDASQIEQDERGAILYASNKSIQGTQIDGYFIYKHDDRVLVNGDQGDIYALGSRVEHLFTQHIKARAEGAYEFGSKNDATLSAWGVNSRLTYMFKDTWNNQLYLNGEALSGNNPNSATNEQFDPLWGRWPQWSELYIYTYARETRIGETTNLLRIGPGYEVNPVKAMTFCVNYHALWALEQPLANTGMFGDGNFRGHLFTGVVKYKFNRYLSGHLLGEYFVPGSYYHAPADEGALYLRAELVVTF